MAFYAPNPGNRYSRHIYDLVLVFDAIERGDIEDDVTPDLLDAYDPVWWMHALEFLRELRTAVEDEIIRCISDARADYEAGEGDPDEFDFATPTWSEIGRLLGVSAQAAQQRYGRQVRPHSLIGEADRGSSLADARAPAHPTALPAP